MDGLISGGLKTEGGFKVGFHGVPYMPTLNNSVVAGKTIIEATSFLEEG